MVIIVFSIAFMIVAVAVMYSKDPGIVNNGQVDLSGIEFRQDDLVTLDGSWEFYWNGLLTPENFIPGQLPPLSSFMKVPGPWNDRRAGKTVYPAQGIATYRLNLVLPPVIKDPAVHIQHVADAYKLYANGRLVAEVGKVSDKASGFQDDEKSLIVDLPTDTNKIELIFQVAQLRYTGGGLRQSPVFGSKHLLEQRRMILLVLQLLFIGSVFIFAIYYFILFLLQRKNKTALLFSLLCLITFIRALIWGESPLVYFFPGISFDLRLWINYMTGINLMPIMILFTLSLFPNESKKAISRIMLAPTLVFDLLLLTPPAFISRFTNFIYLFVLVQMIYLICILVKAVLNKRELASLFFAAVCVFVLTIVADILYYLGAGSINLSYMFLFGNLAVIIAMSLVQARQQADIHQKLVLYNEKLIEADKLKDEILATEMSFLQAQIKPHFLYNALNAIANVCEKDGEKAGELIIDLAIYLRRSLEFNHMDKMVTIEKELEFVDTYFNIERARFGDKIHLRKAIEIPLDYQMPVLILQPLVENAVRHGISKKTGGGTVHIRMKQTDEGALIEIDDDGVGIESEKLSLLLNKTGTSQGVGLLNIHHRLLRMYGKGLALRSEAGQGTCVHLAIPEGRKQA